MGTPHPAFPAVQIDPAAEATDIANLFFRLSAQVRQFRIDNADLTDDDKERLDVEAQGLQARANFFNAESIGATLQSLQPTLDNLKKVTIDAQTAIARLTNVANVVAIATAGVALGAAISAGDVGSIGAALTTLGQAVLKGITTPKTLHV